MSLLSWTRRIRLSLIMIMYSKKVRFRFSTQELSTATGQA
jgi:hypothetical protein